MVTNRLAGLGLAAMMTLLVAGGAIAVYAAGGPGDDLSPLNGAERLVSLTQSQASILWTATSGGVTVIRAVAWPTSDGTHDLGGALVLERPDDPRAGTINIGEKPATVEFTVDG